MRILIVMDSPALYVVICLLYVGLVRTDISGYVAKCIQAIGFV
jgi:hypothetical protein